MAPEIGKIWFQKTWKEVSEVDRGLPSEVTTRLHLQKSSLIECTGVDVNGVPVVGGPVGQLLVMLDCFFQIRGIVLLDVVVRPNGLFEVVIHNHTRALGRGPSDKHHDARTAVDERGLESPLHY